MDELSQLFNVIKGDMSLVGPRPIRKCFADELAARLPFYNIRFFEKPGITGWAQVKFVTQPRLKRKSKNFVSIFFI